MSINLSVKKSLSQKTHVRSCHKGMPLSLWIKGNARDARQQADAERKHIKRTQKSQPLKSSRHDALFRWRRPRGSICYAEMSETKGNTTRPSHSVACSVRLLSCLDEQTSLRIWQTQWASCNNNKNAATASTVWLTHSPNHRQRRVARAVYRCWVLFIRLFSWPFCGGAVARNHQREPRIDHSLRCQLAQNKERQQIYSNVLLHRE